MKIYNNKKGFVLVEILIAVAILSMVLLSVTSGVSSCIAAMNGNKKSTQAMLIARSKLNELILQRMRGADIDRKPVIEYSGFRYSRVTKRFEHPLLGALPAKRTEIIVEWKEGSREKSYKISYIYQAK